MRKIKLEQYLLLLLRIFIIVLLVLAFAGPVIYNLPASFFKSHPQTALVVVIDTSGSMGLNIFGKSVFEDSVEFLRNYIKNFSERDHITVINSEKNPGIIFNGKKSELEDFLDKLNYGDNSAYLNNAIIKGINILNYSEFPNRELLLLSDLQKPALSGRDIKKLGNIKIYARAVDLNPARSRITNAGIESAEINITSSTETYEVKVEIRNKTDKAIKSDITLRNPEKVFEQSFDLPGKSSDTMRFMINSRLVEDKYLEFSLSKDDLGIDNLYYKSVKPTRSFNIGILARNADFKFLSLAIDPYPGFPGRSPYSSNLITTEELDPNKFPVCILLDPADFYDSIEVFSKYLNSGGNLLIFFGTVENPDEINKVYSTIFNLNIKQKLSASESPLKIDRVDFTFPPFSFMEKKEHGSLSQIDFYNLISFSKDPDIISLASS
ncbi:MAG TPA: VWA domain-containing protein, partial [Firmicutes bacterium]|nr:VWA domain-containing protein [Bacillota bacterium]